MKEEPDIIKELREAEKIGKLRCQSQGSVIQEDEEDLDFSIEINEKPPEKLADLDIEDLKESYQTIFENYFIGIMIADEKERIIAWNKYAEQLLKMDEKDLYMKPVKSLYPDEEWKKIRQQDVRKKGMQHHLETRIIRKNAEPLDVDISLSILKNQSGEIIGSIGVIKDISERKKMETKLAYEKDLMQSLLDNIPDSIYFKDEHGRFIKVNEAKAKHSNTTPENMVGKTDFDFLSEDEAQRVHDDDKKVMESNKPIINKLERLKDRMGEEHWISVTKIPRRDSNGNIVGTMGISRNVTKLKEADQVIRKSEKRYKNLFETAIDPIIVLDNKGFFVDVNKQVTNLLGYTKMDLIGKPFNKINILDKESTEKTLDNFIRRMKDENISPYEIKAVAKNGEIIPAEINASPLFEGEKIVGDLIILRDLRERIDKQNVERNLVESEKKFKDIFDSTSDFLIYIEKGIILDTNDTALNMMELSKEQLIGKKFTEIKGIFSDCDNEKQLEFFEKVTRGEKISDHECNLVKKDGTQYIFLFSSDLIKDDEEIVGVLVRGRDITQRQRAWDELVKLEEKYRILAETSADGVVTIDPLGRLTYVNPSFEKMCERRKSQILATLFREYLSDDSVYFFQQIFIDARKKDEKIENVELELVHAGGNIIPIEVNMAPLKKDDKFVGMVCTVRNITERRRIEKELKKSERLKTEFMNIAAHELKSPVTPIKGYLDLIMSDKDASKKVKDWAKVSLRNTERLLRLVNDILDVSRLDTDTMRFDMEKINPVEILIEIAEDMKPAVEQKGVKFIVDIPKTLPNIMGDRYRLLQVLENLMVNAIKFTDNGSIAVVAKKEDNHIIISVEDTGLGISKDELKKIFTKFYQAYTGDDRKNEGTGLGLFICKEILQKHDGDIWVESEIKKGSKFTLKLPYIHKMVVNIKKD